MRNINIPSYHANEQEELEIVMRFWLHCVQYAWSMAEKRVVHFEFFFFFR